VAASYDPPTQRVTVEGVKADSVTCAGGAITYFYPLPAPDLTVVDPASSPARLVRGFKMPANGGALSFTRAELGLIFTRKYRLDVTWSVGLGPNPTGSAEVEIALPPPPPKKPN